MSAEELVEDYTLAETAAALRMSTRWVRQQVAAGAVHIRRGHKIIFTAEQVELLRIAGLKVPAEPVKESITTGPKKRSR